MWMSMDKYVTDIQCLDNKKFLKLVCVCVCLFVCLSIMDRYVTDIHTNFFEFTKSE